MMVKKSNPALDLSFELTVQVVKFCYQLQRERREYILSKQLIRSAASIGANLEEAIGGQSEKDFLAKISISYKEARETAYWLKTLYACEFIQKEKFNEFYSKADEIMRILGSSIRTLKRKLHKLS